MVRYWDIRVSGWINSQFVCGEEMTTDEAIEEMGTMRVKPKECWAPTEITESEYQQYS